MPIVMASILAPLLYTIICYMVFPIYMVNVSKHPHLSCTYLLQY